MARDEIDPAWIARALAAVLRPRLRSPPSPR